MTVPQERFIKINAINIRYWAEGQGDPIILIHGMAGSATGWLPSFSALSAQRRVIAMDLVGHGRSGDLPDPCTPDSAYLARFVNDFMAELKIERADIVGHSMGSAIALLLAINFPARVNKLVLVDGMALGPESTPFLRFLSLPLIGELLFAQLYKQDLKKYAADMRGSAQNASFMSDELVENLYQVERTPRNGKTFLRTFRLAFDWRGQKKSTHGLILPKLPTLQNPALVIWGRQDDTNPLAHGESAARSLPNARLEIIEKCGHIPMFEQPEIFNQLVLAFLNN
jgi:4,5:9,10-diseco-3-hydroxy-5,9,17-trioxoandrosta-1(10),2-diene-4-oate hydrolase